ncbi:hypothetical protein T440DRAFT_258396 [Plenodomus tracheiphilus IPT5]|uniref:Uncharacterized protein n=1 Tax=Plenodomus tracheiphilus IPT5 TaxID=1408161 RepID=A0A6A7AR87_9PLEO|nr:hypothetical protein T440DRAFT_258396 [Plenodomus tracheiphilus IPT5]
MEVISGVASAFAIVSLSIQLLDKINTFCGFWEKVQGAPEYVLELAHEPRLLEAVVKEIQQKEQTYGRDPDAHVDTGQHIVAGGSITGEHGKVADWCLIRQSCLAHLE